MKRRFKRTRRGQALAMVTLSLTSLIGIIAMAVDIGWSQFVKRSAQAAADSAAMAAIIQAYANVGNRTPVCGTGVVCQAATACPSSIGTPAHNLQNGCAYA